MYYTIIDNEIYLIKGDKLVKHEIKNGMLVNMKEAIDMPEDISLALTFEELRLKFAEQIEASREEVEEQPKPQKAKEESKDKE